MTSAATPAVGPATLRGKVQQTYLDLVGGGWIESESGRTFEDRNPADTREVIAIFPESGAADVRQAVSAAREALRGWAATPAPRRQAILLRAAQALRARGEELAQALTWEEGKVLAQARQEIARGLDAMEYLASEGRRLWGHTVPSERAGVFAWTQRRPVGVAGVITSWEFPFSVPASKITPALVCGNTVVLKPAEQTPLCAQLLAEALVDAGLPPGVLNLVHGGADAGRALVEDPHVRVISFTGSTEVGKRVNLEAARRMARVQLDMGARNACIVLPDADLDRAAGDVVACAFGGTGQCNGPTSRLIVDRKVKHALLEKVLAQTKGILTGSGFAEGIALGPLVDERALEKVERCLEIARSEGNQILSGGSRARQRPEHEHGWFFEPTVVAEVAKEHTLAREEVFGPVLAVLEAAGLEEALEIANGVDHGLGGSLYTRDLGAALEYARRAEAAVLHVNMPATRGEIHLPCGGSEDPGSGGRDLGPAASGCWTEWQTAYLRYE